MTDEETRAILLKAVTKANELQVYDHGPLTMREEDGLAVLCDRYGYDRIVMSLEQYREIVGEE
jgi:hypothetical protein